MNRGEKEAVGKDSSGLRATPIVNYSSLHCGRIFVRRVNRVVPDVMEAAKEIAWFLKTNLL